MNARLTIILAVCVLLAAMGFGYVKRKANQMVEARGTPQVLQQPARPVGATPAAPGSAIKPDADPNAPKPIGYGLTYALVPDRNPDAATLSCTGEPSQLDRPYNGSCNPHQGDTSCRTVLPVLCFRPGAAPAPSGNSAPVPAAPGSAPVPTGYGAWTGGTLGGAPAIMGAILDSEAAAHAYCERELGPGWRMAEYQDGGRGGLVQGQRSLGLSQNQRHWVLSRNQPANCWNSRP